MQVAQLRRQTGFEFKNQRAIPVITGIVVAAEQKDLVMDAYEESAQAAEERERIKKEDKALKRWIKLMNGLRVRRRLQAEYGQSDNVRHPHFHLGIILTI
jgi:xeroderma pigmentosum group C-complementing protein